MNVKSQSQECLVRSCMGQITGCTAMTTPVFLQGDQLTPTKTEAMPSNDVTLCGQYKPTTVI